MLPAQLGKGRHLQISCCEGTCFLQSLSKATKSLLYTLRVITVTQNLALILVILAHCPFCKRFQHPEEVLDETERGWEQEEKQSTEELQRTPSTPARRIKVHR